MKMECLRSPLDCAREVGVICSATHEGFLSRRSKEEIRECRVARSATGPGNPYWKRPAGSTGAMMSFVWRGTPPGIGAGTEVVDVAETEVEDATACIFFSERVEYIAAVTPAPVAALTAAIIARVVLDILGKSFLLKPAWLRYLFVLRGCWRV